MTNFSKYNYLLCFIFLLSFSFSNAQDWAEEGAEYRFLKVITLGFTGGTIGCETRTLAGDTSVGSLEYQRLVGEYFSRDWNFGILSDYEVSYLPDILLRTGGDTTWFLSEGEEFIMANFNAQVGESWESPLLAPEYGSAVSSPMVITVDSIGSIDVADQVRPIMYFSFSIEAFEDCYEIGTGHIIKGLFYHFNYDIEYMLPIYIATQCISDYGDFYLFSEYRTEGETVFSEDIFGYEPLYCSLLEVGLDTYDLIKFDVYPNPVHNILNIQVEHPYEMASIEIMDASGRVILNSGYRSQLDISSFEKGLYLLRVYDEAGKSSSQLLNVE